MKALQKSISNPKTSLFQILSAHLREMKVSKNLLALVTLAAFCLSASAQETPTASPTTSLNGTNAARDAKSKFILNLAMHNNISETIVCFNLV